MVQEGTYGGIGYILIHANGKMRPIGTVLRMGRGGNKGE
jgi:hypothetical protein